MLIYILIKIINSVHLKADGKKIKTNLRLPAKEVTYLRYIMDSNLSQQLHI